MPTPTTPDNIHDRFWAKVAKAGPNDCWLWTASKDNHGYGHFTYYGRIITASRACWLLTNGEIAPGLEVCHICDVPSCVNPAHLFLGTHEDNMIDRGLKGRTAGGTGRAKVNAEQRAEMTQLYDTGNFTLQALADKYGITKTNIRRNILRYKAENAHS